MNAAAAPSHHPQRTSRHRARHCAELLAQGPSLGELAPALAMAGERLSRALRAGLAKLDPDAEASVTCAMPAEARMETFAQALPAQAFHVLLGIGEDAFPALACFEGMALLRMTDRLFGGVGRAPDLAPRGPKPDKDPAPDATADGAEEPSLSAELPLSAMLLAQRVEAVLSDALGSALGLGPAAVKTLRREDRLNQISAFPADEALLTLTIAIRSLDGSIWSLPIAFPRATLAALLVPQRRRAIPAASGRGDPAREPYASLPISLHAVLVDMRMPFSRACALKPGDILPVAVARNVPIRIGERTFATGAIGEVDDRVAVQLAFPERTQTP